MFLREVRTIDANVDVQDRNRPKSFGGGGELVGAVAQQPVDHREGDCRQQVIVGFLPVAGKSDDLGQWIDRFKPASGMDVTERRRESVGETIDSAVLRVRKTGVVPHALVRQSQRSVDHLFEARLGNRPAHPIGGDPGQVCLPEFLVVRKHEVVGDAGAECLQRPLPEVVRSGRIAADAFDEAHQAFFDDFRWESVCVRLKGIGCQGGLRVDRGPPFHPGQRVGKDPVDEFLGVGILQMDQVARDVERKPVLNEGPADSSDPVLFLEDQRFEFLEMKTAAQASQSSTDDNDFFHGFRWMGFRNRLRRDRQLSALSRAWARHPL